MCTELLFSASKKKLLVLIGRRCPERNERVAGFEPEKMGRALIFPEKSNYLIFIIRIPHYVRTRVPF